MPLRHAQENHSDHIGYQSHTKVSAPKDTDVSDFKRNKISVDAKVLLDREGGIEPVDMPNRPFGGHPSSNSNVLMNPRYHRCFHQGSKYSEDIPRPLKIVLLYEGYKRWNSSPEWNMGFAEARARRRPLHDPDHPSTL